KVISFGKRLITGTDIGVGKVVVEAELLDGETNQRIAAAMDARAGSKALRSKFSGYWGDVKLAFEWWGERLDKRLMALKRGGNGIAPAHASRLVHGDYFVWTSRLSATAN